MYIGKNIFSKQMCAFVLLKLNIKLFFGIKHITEIKRYAIRRQTNVCKHIFFFFFQIPILFLKNSNACVSFFLNSNIIYTQCLCYTQFSKTKYKSKINKAMLMHILIMTLNKLNNVHISVFCSDNACLSLIKILWAS